MKFSNTKSLRPFWETCKSYFSNNHSCVNSKIMLFENDKLLLENQEVTKEFGHIIDSFDLYEFPDGSVCKGLDDIDNIVHKIRNHLSIIKIKE